MQAPTTTEPAIEARTTRIKKEDILVFLICIVPSFIVGIHGLSRPYDAIPDQDMLWASEALRLLRGVAPSYADHPGAFWTLAYKANIITLQGIFNSQILDPSGNILPEGLELLIRVARIENAILSGLCAALTYPLALLLSTKKPLAAASSLIVSLSSATLVSVSEIRNEAISVFFLLLFILCTSYSAKKRTTDANGLALGLAGLFLFFAAALAKQQVLLTAPLAFIAVFAALRTNNRNIYEAKLGSLIAARPKRIAGLFITASAPWLIAAHPDIDLINLPAWTAINIGLALCLSINFKHFDSKLPLLKPLLVVGLFEVVLFKLLIPGWWRQAVTGFPSWMFRHADPTNDHTGHTLSGINTYLSELFTPHLLAATALAGVLLISIAQAARETDPGNKIRTSDRIGTPTAWLLTIAILVASSQRVASRYEIYFFIPIIILSAATAGHQISNNADDPNTKPPLITKALTSIILITALTTSLANASELRMFVNRGQPEHFKCFSHHMDRTMRLTSAAQCKIFNQAILEKDQYDSWVGPR
jgi:hypothetical protein